jgi:hypothetical protein
LVENGYIDAAKAQNLLEKAIPKGIAQEVALSSNEECARFSNITAQCKYLTLWFMKPKGSIPHSQGLSNNPYSVAIQSNYSY